MCSKIPGAPNAVLLLLVPQMLRAPKYRVPQWLCSKLQCSYGCAPIAVHLVPASKFFMLHYSYKTAPTLRTYSELVANVQFRNFAAQWPLGVIIEGFSCDHEKIWGFHPAYWAGGLCKYSAHWI